MSEWISVKDRLPEHKGEYLVAFHPCYWDRVHEEICIGLDTFRGKIVPLEKRCGAKITPPCYQADGDGCAYQIYGDDNDEPIDRCKSCPLCYSDKVRYRAKQEAEKNDTLTPDELREMDAPVWCECKPIEGGNGYWCLCQNGHITTPAGTQYYVDEIPHWVFLRRKPEEG